MPSSRAHAPSRCSAGDPTATEFCASRANVSFAPSFAQPANAFAQRDEVQRALLDENIATSIHFLPVHRLSAYRERMAPHQPPLPVTERAGEEVLSLPLSPAHSDDDVRDVVAALRRVHARLVG